MNFRILRIELRRSLAPWAGLAVLAIALAYLLLIPGPWQQDGARWTAQWTSMALWTRYPLFFLLPLAVGLGALQGLRDPRAKMAELLASTPRPARHRASVLGGATGLALVSGFALVVLLGAVLVLRGDATYHHPGWLPISLIGAFALVAGAVLGMGVARAVPSALTPPVLAVGGLVLGFLLRQTSDTALPQSTAPNPLSLLSPAVAEVREPLLTLTGPVHLGQALWLLGMAVTGLALLAAATARTRLLALAPLVAGGVVALLVLPSAPRGTYVIDRAAAAQVCDGPVCVTRAHEGRLGALAGPGRETLRVLRLALGDRAPRVIHETVVPRGSFGKVDRAPGVLLVDFDDRAIGGAEGKTLTRALVGQGMAPLCGARSATESGAVEEAAAQSIGAAWVLGGLKPLDGTMHDARSQGEKAVPAWQKLTALPRPEQQKRIDAMHAAAVSCSGDALTALGGVK
ncbi:hypothetical protein [Streptomyces sp. NPDC051561]|uniref:hypothetical protein n=1 Tax=Streptomyces sp. NPDC051561 TaxID=3365658 RepID=UPI0037A27E6B